MKTKKAPKLRKRGHPHYMCPKKGWPVCRTCFIFVPKRAGLLAAHIDWHRSEGHRVKTEEGWEN